jgi:hypothetical protein
MMAKFSLVFVAGLVIAAILSTEIQAELPPAPQQQDVRVVKPLHVKIRVEDTGSHLLGKDEAAKLTPDQVAVAKPVVKPAEPGKSLPLAEIKPAVAIVKPAENSVNNNEEKLPPIPVSPLLIPGMPSLFQTILDSLPKFGLNSQENSNADAPSENSNTDDGQPRKIISILMMKHSNSDESTADGQAGPSDEPRASSSFFIFKFLPKFRPEEKALPLVGGKSDPDHSRVLGGKLGGESDPDHTRLLGRPLLGGGGENDPDRMRFKMNPIFTGNDDLFMNNKDNDDDSDEDDDDDNNGDDDAGVNNGPVSIFSIIDRMKNFFGRHGGPMSEHTPQQFVIRTDDGRPAFLPNEFGLGGPRPDTPHRQPPPPPEDPNKCMMLSFMRMKASMYYRTILHLLFFSGVLLFVLFMILLTIRSYKKKRFSTLRSYPHNMTVSTIDGSEAGDVKSTKFKFLRQWSGSDSLGPDAKSSLVNAPPGYDVPYVKVAGEPDTRSLPPEYEDEQPQQQQQGEQPQQQQQGESQPKV